jgi:hypothetical protein
MQGVTEPGAIEEISWTAWRILSEDGFERLLHRLGEGVQPWHPFRNLVPESNFFRSDRHHSLLNVRAVA